MVSSIAISSATNSKSLDTAKKNVKGRQCEVHEHTCEAMHPRRRYENESKVSYWL